MTQLLQTAIDKAKSLSESEQDIIAALLLNAIAKKSDKRPIGLGIGLAEVPDDFNDPLPKEELDAWYEGHSTDPLKSAE